LSRKKKQSFSLSSRILTILKHNPRGITPTTLLKKLNVPKSKAHLIWKTLKRFERNGLIKRSGRQRFYIPKDSESHIGIFRRKTSGAGVVISETDDTRIKISKKDGHHLMDGDRIKVKLVSKKAPNPTGVFQKLVKGRPIPIIGYFHHSDDGCTVVPVNPRIAPEIDIPKHELSYDDHGKVVSVSINQNSRSSREISGVVDSVLGFRDSTGVETYIIINNFALRDRFPQDVELEAEQVRFQIEKSEFSYREDIRDLHTITIDPESARDFDDALTLDTHGSGYRLGVHIADVSHYVAPGSAIDKEAYQRGTSIYFPERAVHMLPENLSTNICSLNPGTDKLCMTVWIHLDAEGTIINGRCAPTIIHSDKRLTYEQYLAAATGNPSPELSDTTVSLCKNLAKICELLLVKRVERGVLELDMPEAYFVLDPENRVIDIKKRTRSIAEQSVEEFMIAANVVVAQFLDKHDIPYLRRVHEPPDFTAINDLIASLEQLELVPPDNPLDPDQVRAFLATIDSGPVRAIASYQILRAMKRAVYSSSRKGHFGLALETYTQFTSPIRRYPDLEVHRSIKSALNLPGETYQWSVKELNERAKWLSDKERVAQEAEWQAAKLQKIKFMETKLGEVYVGTITHVEEFGAFTEIDQPFVDGLIPVYRLDEYYRYFPERNALVNPDSTRILKPGTMVRVKVELADQDRNILDFTLEDIVTGE